MKPTVILLLSLVYVLPLGAQQTVANTANTAGVQLMFKGVTTKLTAVEKESIFKQLGFSVAPDRKQFIAGADAKEFPFTAEVLPTDLNRDGIEELFVVYGNSFTSGHTGSSVVLFIKNAAGQYESNLGFPGTAPDVLPTTSKGYPDLVIGGPGFSYPVWRWNGKKYDLLRQISDKALTAAKARNIAELSAAHTRQ